MKRYIKFYFSKYNYNLYVTFTCWDSLQRGKKGGNTIMFYEHLSGKYEKRYITKTRKCNLTKELKKELQRK